MYKKTIEEYLDKSDWRVKENASMPYSYQGLMLHMCGEMQKDYVLSLYDKEDIEIGLAHAVGFFHIHDLSFGLASYCAGWSLHDLLVEGFSVDGRTSSSPPKHFDSALGQIVNFIGCLQNEWAGAQALNNFDTLLAPFIKMDNLSYREVYQSIQKFVFNLNTSSRWGGQAPFTNISFDVKVPDNLAFEKCIVGGVEQNFTYHLCRTEMEMLNEAFLDVMLQGDAKQRIFSYPIPNYNITQDFPWDGAVGQKLLAVTAKYGIPYFQNFINSDLKPEDVRSMCCRLRLDLSQLRKKTGGLFGNGNLTGSTGVVTLNLPRIAYTARHSKEIYFEILSKHANLAKKALIIKRKYLQKFFAEGLFPFSKKFLKCGYKNHFNTIGVIGGHEACLNFLGSEKGINTAEGKEFMVETLNFLSDLCLKFQEETGMLFNLEATPAESTSYRLAKLDREYFNGFLGNFSGTREAPYYTNSTHLPVDFTDDIFEAITHQEDLQTIYTGGTMFHCFLGHEVVDLEALKNLIIKIFTNTKMPSISITPTFSICEEHGYFSGKHFYCPDCNAKTEIYSRIVGYYRPISRWNDGKKQEFEERKEYEF